MLDNRDLMNALETLETSDPALTDTEMQHLTRAVLTRTACGNPAARRTGHAVKSRRSFRRLPAWGQVLTAGAACAVLLVGLNGINPALAEGLPLLGDVFAYFNDLPKGYLQGNDLGEYAQPTQIEAEVQQDPAPEARDEAAPKVQAAAGNILTENPCTLTLSQVYCDELYLRVGLVLTAEDDTLAGFDAVTIDPPLLYEDTTEAEANTLYGGVTLNGESVGGDLVPCFRKQDDHTFFCEMQYNLQNYTGDTRDMQASLTFSHLVGITEESEDKIPLEGTYNLTNTNYNRDVSEIAGNPEYDIATNLWNERWQIPTKEQWQELIDECTWEYQHDSDHNLHGYLVTGTNGNSIYLPMYNYIIGTNEPGESEYPGYYWSSTEQNDYHAYCMYLYTSSYSVNHYEYKYYRMLVRPVLAK